MELGPREAESLARKLGITEEEVQQQFQGFMARHPEGHMTRAEFIVGCMERDASEDQADALFNVFDGDNSETIDFSEFVMACNATSLKYVSIYLHIYLFSHLSLCRSRNDKLSWIFDVFDKDAGGTIDPKEMIGVVAGLYTMMGIEVPDEIVEERSKEILEICDNDGDGEITKDEFITNALTCDFICDVFQILDDDDEEAMQNDDDEEEETTMKNDNIKECITQKEDVSEICELEAMVVDRLSRKLGIMEEEVLDQHKIFIKTHPKGTMTKADFISSCLEKDGISEDKAEALFNVFDGDESGTMDFVEFLMASNATTLR
jgi:Ca2+-binding EF-hand superfamily protein